MRRLLRSRIRGIEFTNYVYLTHCDPCQPARIAFGASAERSEVARDYT